MEAHGCLPRWGWGSTEVSDSRMDKKMEEKGRLELGKETQVRTKSRSRAPLWINLAREMLFPGGSDDKESACNGRLRFSPWVGKIPWRRKWLPTLVFLPGEFHEQKSLVGYSPRDHKEADWTNFTSLVREEKKTEGGEQSQIKITMRDQCNGRCISLLWRQESRGWETLACWYVL